MSVDLYPVFRLGDLNLASDPYGIEFDHSMGEVDQAREALAHLLAGARLEPGLVANRELTFSVLIFAGSPNLHALHEADLAAECAKELNELALAPGDGFSETSVFDVVAADATYLYSADDVRSGVFRWSLKLTCLPYPRSDREITVNVAAPSTSGAVSILDSCDAATGWTVQDPAGSVQVVSAGLRFDLPADQGGANYAFYKTFATAWDSDEYLRIDWNGSNVDRVDVFAGPDGNTALTQVAQDGSTRWYERPGSLTEVGKLWLLSWRATTGQKVRTFLTEIALTDVTYYPKTGRTSQRTIPVQGSAPSEASLEIGANTALGEVLAYTYPDLGDYRPRLRMYPTTGATEGDGGTVSGSWLRIFDSGGGTFSIPAAALPTSPSGTYTLMTRLMGNAAGRSPITWTMTVGAASTTGVSYPNLTTGARIYALDRITVPARTTSDSDAVVSFNLSGAARLDEAWLLHDSGELTWVRADTALSVRIVAPSLNHPQPAVYADGVGASIEALGRHDWQPGDNQVDLMTEAVGAWTSLTYSPRWHTHAGPVVG